MKQATKGALAAGAAGSLLLGGAGSLAYWTDTGTVDGSSISSGHMSLTENGCDGWKLDGGAAYTTQTIVPGDSLTQVCTFTLNAQGDHLTASFGVATPTWATANGLTAELTKSAVYQVGATTVSSFPAAVVNGDTITATVTVTFPTTSTVDTSYDLTAILNDITVTVTQGHTA